MFAELQPATAAEAALSQYKKRLEVAKQDEKGEFQPLGRDNFAQPQSDNGPKEATKSGDVRAQLALDLASAKDVAKNGSLVVDGEPVLTCLRCQLPLGQRSYADGVPPESPQARERLVHAECKAQSLLLHLHKWEQERKREGLERKQARREEFGIGWSPAETIPSNPVAAKRLGCAVVPQGMCCLVGEKDSSAVRVAPTFEPAAALNLEYLSIALQVRRTEGREPLFSLDPLQNDDEPQAPENAMQEKRFDPEWLAGTSLGDVMFQADYHLKELSFGEYEQPVVGMQSCFDYSESESTDVQWSAREWFVVRKAEIHVSDDQVFIPYLKMGVEAREQIPGDNGLEDAPLTRPDHPLVRYADSFTYNFDLIAERKSVIAQLREVAKASVMAKYLLDSGSNLPGSWFNGYDAAKPACCLEVPQMWNDRCFSTVCVDGTSIKTGRHPKTFGLYGGVDFGIDRFRLSQPSRVATSVVAGRASMGRPASTLISQARAGFSAGPARQFSRLCGPLNKQMTLNASKVGLGMPRYAAGLSMGRPQGVDLNLDKFNLSVPAQQGGLWGGSIQAKDARLAIGASFWPSLEDGNTFSPDDASLLKEVFHPCLSDRRQDAEHFTPPPTSASYMQKLRQLIKGEQLVRSQRKEHFCSADFRMDKAGPLFPRSWAPSVELEQQLERPEVLQPRMDFVSEVGLLREALQSAAPIFDRCTEDGTKFRIYTIGGLQIRTTQEHGGEEVVAAVFSVCAPYAQRKAAAAPVAWASGPAASWGVADSERIVRATEYVESAEGAAARFRSYVVLETEEGHLIVVEQAEVGVVPWSENPAGLEDRNSLAKVIRSKECQDDGATVGAVKSCHVQEIINGSSSSVFAQAVYCNAIGEKEDSSGFHKCGPSFLQMIRITTALPPGRNPHLIPSLVS